MKSAVNMFMLAAMMTCAAAPAVAQSVVGSWLADDNSGCKIWNPHPEPGETVRWLGPCIDGLAHGNGKLQWFKSGRATETDEGEWRRGHQFGRGSQVWPAGRYEGDVVDGLPHGHGVLTLSNATYDGQFRDGKANGAGTLTRSGKTYQGTWTNGCFNDGKSQAAIGVLVESCR